MRGELSEKASRRGAGGWRGIDRAVERAKCEKIKGSSLTNSSKGKYMEIGAIISDVHFVAFQW
jgi:hypothetical protein